MERLLHVGSSSLAALSSDAPGAGRSGAEARAGSAEAKTERDQEHAQKVDLLVPSEQGPQKGVSPTFLWEHLWIYALSKYLKSKTRKSSRRRQDVLCLLDQCLLHASFPCLLNGVRKFVHSSSELRLVEILGSESLHHLFDCP